MMVLLTLVFFRVMRLWWERLSMTPLVLRHPVWSEPLNVSTFPADTWLDSFSNLKSHTLCYCSSCFCNCIQQLPRKPYSGCFWRPLEIHFEQNLILTKCLSLFFLWVCPRPLHLAWQWKMIHSKWTCMNHWTWLRHLEPFLARYNSRVIDNSRTQLKSPWLQN